MVEGKTGAGRSTAAPVRRTQVERSATTRQALLDAAIDCINDHGYLHATVGVISERANVSRGAVQHHFGTRNDLLVAVIDEFGSALSPPAAISGSLEQRVGAIIDSTWEVMRSPHFLAIVQIWLAVRSDPELLASLGDKIAGIENDLDRRWQDLLGGPGLPATRAATTRHVVIAALRGLALRTVYRTTQESWVDEVAMLKAFAVHTLSSA